MSTSVKKKEWLSTPLIFSIISGILLLSCQAFEWDIVDLITPFLLLPLQGLLFFFAFICAIVAIVHIFRHKDQGAFTYAPILVSVGVFLTAFFFPFTQLWLNANFHLKRGAREQVVADVKAGILKPNVSYNSELIALEKGQNLSSGGDEILVEGEPGDEYVFFFTYRGILDNYSGFLWVPKLKKPEGFSDLHEPSTQIIPFGGNWYYVSHR